MKQCYCAIAALENGQMCDYCTHMLWAARLEARIDKLTRCVSNQGDSIDDGITKDEVNDLLRGLESDIELDFDKKLEDYATTEYVDEELRDAVHDLEQADEQLDEDVEDVEIRVKKIEGAFRAVGRMTFWQRLSWLRRGVSPLN